MSLALPNSGAGTPASAANSDHAPGGQDPSGPTSAGLYDPAVPAALQRLLQRYGADLLAEPGRLRGLLQDECPQARREASVLLQALDAQVPQDLMPASQAPAEPLTTRMPRLARRLIDEKSLSPQAALWAVDAWAQGLGLAASLPTASAWPGGMPAQPPAVAIDMSPTLPPAGWVERLQALPATTRRWGVAALVAVVALALWFGLLAPEARILDAHTDGPLVGNGKPQAVRLSVALRRTQVERIDVRFVRGDMATWATPAWQIPVAGSEATADTLPAGTLALRTDKPATAVFEYTLVDRDGRRSVPREQSFTFLPPVTITGVRLPRSLVVGQNFAATILFKRGGADIVQVERRIRSSSVPIEPALTTAPVQAGSGASVEYRFEAAKQPLRSTVEFVLVDAQGVRSEPYAVTLDIGTASRAGTGPATVLAIRAVKESGHSSGFGAVIGAVTGALLCNRTVGKGQGKGAATVLCGAGGGYAGNEAEKAVRGSSRWEVSVRFDDGVTRVVSMDSEPRWHVGDRVTLEGGAIVGP